MTSNFLNRATMLEKKQMLADSMKPTTFHKMSEITDPDLIAGGRFAASANIVSGTASHVPYPPLPADNPWHHDPVGIEPPLGFSVETVPICGEPHEQPEAIEANSESIGPACADAPASREGSLLLHLDAETPSASGSAASSTADETAQRAFSPNSTPGVEEHRETGLLALGGRLVGAGVGSEPTFALPSTIKRRSFSK